MGLPFLELQTAVYQRLANDDKVKNMVTKIADHISDDMEFPYIVIGEPSLTFEEIKNADVSEVSLTLHVWSSQEENRGNRQTYEILNAIFEALRPKLHLSSFDLIRVRVQEPKVFDDIDDRVKHGVIIYRFTLKRRG